MEGIFNLLRDKLYIAIKSGVEYARYKGVKVGNDCRILTTKFGSEPWLITIGNKVTITSGVVLLTHDGSTWSIKDQKGRRYLYKRIVIGNNVFIGVNSILMPGVRIDDNVIIAAGSIVTKSVPSGVIVAGNPARIIGQYEDYKQQALANYISEQDLDFSKKYKERVEEVVDNEFKKYL